MIAFRGNETKTTITTLSLDTHSWPKRHLSLALRLDYSSSPPAVFSLVFSFLTLLYASLSRRQFHSSKRLTKEEKDFVWRPLLPTPSQPRPPLFKLYDVYVVFVVVAAPDAVPAKMTSFTDKIDPFSKTSKKKPRKSQGSSRFRTKNEVELQSLPLLKGNLLISTGKSQP